MSASSPPDPERAGPEAALVFDRVSKSFPGVRALDDVSFAVARGSIHAIVGENGAGKSTLMKVLAGVHRPDDGSLILYGRPTQLADPAAALRLGIAIIYQELHLVGHLSVAENVLLGRWPTRSWGRIDRPALARQAGRWLDRVGVDVSPTRAVSELTIAQQQLVEIARGLSLDSRILVLDEPSAVLTPHELGGLFTLIRQLRGAGVSILYISHRLEEIFALADTVTVLRDGRHVSTKPVRGLDRDTLIREMVGRDLPSTPRTAPPTSPGSAAASSRAPILRVESLSWPGRIEEVTFSVGAGEVFGLTGLVGSGRSSLLQALFGAGGPLTGGVWAGPATGPFRSPREAMRAGIAYLPEDRRQQGLLLRRSLTENASLASLRELSRAGVLRRARERRRTAEMTAALDIRAAGPAVIANTLSGGNQQKVLLARWLDRPHRVMLFDEPTRGIDVGAKEEIYQWIRRLAEEGAAVIVSSSEFPEVLRLAHRIGVMRGGRLAAIVDARAPDLDAETLLRHAAGEAAR